MTFQPVLDTVEVDCKFLLAGVKPAQFSVYVKNDTAGFVWGATEMQAVGGDVRDAIVDDYVPVLSVDHTFLGVEVRDLEQQYGRVEPVMLAVPAAGTRNSPSLPRQVTVVGRLLSATGQPRRGRINLMSPCEDQVEGTSVAAAAVAGLEAALDAIAAAADGGVGQAHVILSRFSGVETYTKTSKQGNELTLERAKKRANVLTATVASTQIRSKVGTLRERATD